MLAQDFWKSKTLWGVATILVGAGSAVAAGELDWKPALAGAVWAVIKLFERDNNAKTRDAINGQTNQMLLTELAVRSHTAALRAKEVDAQG